MSRPEKRTVDYFPHIIKNGKTITILENKFGNDGYAFWFKLLEILGSTEGHVYEYKNPSEKEFLHARTKVKGEKAVEILDLLADLGAIDKELWGENIIWSDNFVENIEDVYSRRKVNVPQKPQVSEVNDNKNPKSGGDNDNKNPQSKVKETKLIYNHWREKSETITHRKLTTPMKKSINARLNDGYTLEELKKAIDNYNMVLASDDYFFSYDNWSLDDFLSREEGKHVEKFLENPEGFKKDKTSGKGRTNPTARVKDTRTEAEKEMGI